MIVLWHCFITCTACRRIIIREYSGCKKSSFRSFTTRLLQTCCIFRNDPYCTTLCSHCAACPYSKAFEHFRLEYFNILHCYDSHRFLSKTFNLDIVTHTETGYLTSIMWLSSSYVTNLLICMLITIYVLGQYWLQPCIVVGFYSLPVYV